MAFSCFHVYNCVLSEKNKTVVIRRVRVDAIFGAEKMQTPLSLPEGVRRTPSAMALYSKYSLATAKHILLLEFSATARNMFDSLFLDCRKNDPTLTVLTAGERGEHGHRVASFARDKRGHRVASFARGKRGQQVASCGRWALRPLHSGEGTGELFLIPYARTALFRPKRGSSSHKNASF